MRHFWELAAVILLAAVSYLVEPLGGNEEESKFLGFRKMPFQPGHLFSPRKKLCVDGGSGGDDRGTADALAISAVLCLP
jgi:hypothetical protein